MEKKTKQGYIEEVAAYIRVSHQEQKMHGLSIEAQQSKLTEYAEAHGLKIVAWYNDAGISARKLIKKRPELQRMIKDAQGGKFKRIIFIKLDRYFRSVAEFHECQKQLDDAGVTWTATEEKYDMSTANGRAFVNMKLTIAELEADQTGERIKLVNEYKVKTGMPLFGTDSMPFCFAVEAPENGDRHKYIKKRNEIMMEDLIDRVFTQRSVRAGYLYIREKYGVDIGYNAVMGALRNEMICGRYRDNPNYCEGYITPEQFDELQKIINRNPRTTAPNHAYIFSGLIKCPGCGRRLTGSLHKTKRRGKEYAYWQYRCPAAKMNAGCTFTGSVFEKPFEKLMLAELENILADKKAAAVKVTSAERQRVSKHNIPKLQEELDRLNYSWQKGRIKSVEEYDRRYDEITAKIDLANAERIEASAEPDFEKVEAILSAGWKGIYSALDDEHKRAFWRTFIDEIRLNHGWSKWNKKIEDVIFF